jgi:hypothetical protein
MKAELQKKLYEKYQKIFRQKDLPMDQTCMCWGMDCGDGWFWLLDNLCKAIQSYINSHNDGVRIRKKHGTSLDGDEERQVEATQVKEKFGSLRFYINGGDEYVYGMIALAETMSWNICETCGSTEDIIHTGGWISTMCKSCESKKKNNP